MGWHRAHERIEARMSARWLAGICLALGAASASAQTFPSRPIHFAVASQTRMAQLPQVPTLAEAGFPNYESASWIAFFGPAKLSENIAQLLNAEINAALGQAEVRERLTTIGLEPRTMTQPQFAEYMKTEVAKWGEVIKKTGITPN